MHVIGRKSKINTQNKTKNPQSSKKSVPSPGGTHSELFCLFRDIFKRKSTLYHYIFCFVIYTYSHMLIYTCVCVCVCVTKLSIVMWGSVVWWPGLQSSQQSCLIPAVPAGAQRLRSLARYSELKDLESPQRWQMWLRFSPWPGSFHMPCVQPLKKEKRLMPTSGLLSLNHSAARQLE